MDRSLEFARHRLRKAITLQKTAITGSNVDTQNEKTPKITNDLQKRRRLRLESLQRRLQSTIADVTMTRSFVQERETSRSFTAFKRPWIDGTNCSNYLIGFWSLPWL
jgi:ABC-type multidrug transport system fused ATPase/permease subunit